LEKESILESLDFELELVLTDNINYDYIIALIAQIVNETDEVKREKKKEKILNDLKNNIALKSKFELIKKFIEQNTASGDTIINPTAEFEKY
jgi:type I restriction enzyme R subunit